MVHGELFSSADEPSHVFQHCFAAEEEGTNAAAMMALQSPLLLDPYPEELPAAPHSSLPFDPYSEEPLAVSAGSAGSATEKDDGVSQSPF